MRRLPPVKRSRFACTIVDMYDNLIFHNIKTSFFLLCVVRERMRDDRRSVISWVTVTTTVRPLLASGTAASHIDREHGQPRAADITTTVPL